jgi:protein gp37
MGDTSKIEWTDSTWNPWIGCQHVSPGCDHCYAESQNAFRKWNGGTWGPHAPRKRTSTSNWRKPIIWDADAFAFARGNNGRRRRVFCASLADWLDNKVPRPWRADLCALIERTPRLDWLLLTKRPENFRKFAPPGWHVGLPSNVWFGFTAEDEEHYRRRWPIVAGIRARVRFVSYEPAIGPLGRLQLAPIRAVPDWVICGGESGPKARTMNPQWARDVRDQCAALGSAFFLKQHGTYRSNPMVWAGATEAEARAIDPPSNGKGGALLDSAIHRAFPDQQDGRQRAIA